MRTAVTISLVPEARGGPFVYWDGVEDGMRRAREAGFDAVEIFPPGPDFMAPQRLGEMLRDHGLALAAVGTGAGWVKHRLQLCDPDPWRRLQARAFIRSVIDFAGTLGAPAIIGSMQGRWGDGVDRADATRHLLDALDELGDHAHRRHGNTLLYEPLNRYETNLCNTLAAGVELIRSLEKGTVALLADLFHLQIEEADPAAALTGAGPWIGHVHWADSNRRAAGLGHSDLGAAAAALRRTGYAGYLSAEVLPLPDSDTAAAATLASVRRHWPRGTE